MIAPPEDTNRSLRLQQGTLCVEFQWKEDRFSHRILVDEKEVAFSVEGDSSNIWPPSPPLQDLSLEDIAGVPTIMGVGSAGRSHWSISIHWDAKQDGFLFDVACRVREKGMTTDAQQFGNHYKIAKTGLIKITAGCNSSRTQEKAAVTLCPESVDADIDASTVRWRYHVACSVPNTL